VNEYAVARDVLADLPARMRAHRYRLNLPLTALSAIVGVSDRNLGSIERGSHNPSLPLTLAILDWMARSADDPPQPGEPREQAHARAVRARAARSGP
jgi:DNA-binding XRE family transcriptional regulator